MKVRALGLTQYDAILLLDSDVAVVGDLSPLFALPTEFAAVWDQPKLLGRQGGGCSVEVLSAGVLCCCWEHSHCTWVYRPVHLAHSQTSYANSALMGHACHPTPPPPLHRWGPHLRGINGGMLLLRPCKAVMRHMLALLALQPKLRFSHGAAEQDFFHWYYKYTGLRLPLEYNTMASDSLVGNRTLGGRDPVVVHFTRHKPFHGPQPGRPGHQFLCRLDEMEER
jgi:alpha-N-acetylglucosamine transferase